MTELTPRQQRLEEKCAEVRARLRGENRPLVPPTRTLAEEVAAEQESEPQLVPERKLVRPKREEAKEQPFIWDRAATLALANSKCTYCMGYGRRFVYSRREVPCNCVFRKIFRACLNKFREIESYEGMGHVALEFNNKGATNRHTYGRKREEFAADFVLVARRTLPNLERQVFNLHFVLGADWRMCCQRLGMDRGSFFHTVYRIEQRLGRVFRELKPHSLFPIDEYFASIRRRDRAVDSQAA